MTKFSHEYHLAASAEDPSSHLPPRLNLNSITHKKSIFVNLLAILSIIAGCVLVIFVVLYNFQCQLFEKCKETTLVELKDNSTLLTSGLLSGNVSPIQDTSINLIQVDHDNQESSTNYEKWLISTLSESERNAIKELREKVKDKVTHDYMKTVGYLIRWLRAKDWNEEDAEEMLLNHLDWRVEYDMDSVLKDNFTFFEKEFPGYYDGVDYIGGPIITMGIEDWDLRKVSVGGYQREFLRYTFRIFEWGINHLLESQAKGMNVSQGLFIMDANRYTFAKHACFTCISTIGRFLFGMDDNYPGWLHHIIIINASDLAKALIDVMAPYLNGENRDALDVYGFNRTEWQEKILTLAAPDQIRVEFGGTKVDSSDA